MPASDCYIPDHRPSKRQRFERQRSLRVGAVTVHDLVPASSRMTTRILDPVADGRTAGDSGEGCRSGRVEDGVGLLVTNVTRLTLNPHNVTAGINDHVLTPRRAANSDSYEVLSAALVHAGYDVGVEVLNLILGGGGITGEAANEGGNSFRVPLHARAEAVGMIAESLERELVPVHKSQLPDSFAFIFVGFKKLGIQSCWFCRVVFRLCNSFLHIQDLKVRV